MRHKNTDKNPMETTLKRSRNNMSAVRQDKLIEEHDRNRKGNSDTQAKQGRSSVAQVGRLKELET